MKYAQVSYLFFRAAAIFFFAKFLAGNHEPKIATVSDMTTIDQNNRCGNLISKASSVNKSACSVKVADTNMPRPVPKINDDKIIDKAS